MAWNFKREERQYEEIPAGDHRVVIDSAEKATSRAGNDMLVIKMRVSGYTGMLWHYIVFMDDKPEITNRKLTELFDSFAIEDGNFELATYVGKAGAAHVKIDENGCPKVAWFIHKNKQDKLPPWKGKLPDYPVVEPGGFMQVKDEDDLGF